MIQDTPTVINFVLRAWSFVDTQQQTPVKLIVCGNETNTVINTTLEVLMFEVDTDATTRIHTKSEVDLNDYFKVYHVETADCWITTFTLYKEFDAATYNVEAWPTVSSPELALTGTYGSWEWKIDQGYTYRHSLWLNSFTRGNV
jgi:hypothetical protein